MKNMPRIFVRMVQKQLGLDGVRKAEDREGLTRSEEDHWNRRYYRKNVDELGSRRHGVLRDRYEKDGTYLGRSPCTIPYAAKAGSSWWILVASFAFPFRFAFAFRCSLFLFRCSLGLFSQALGAFVFVFSLSLFVSFRAVPCGLVDP